MITMNLYGVPIHNCQRELLDFESEENRCYYRMRGKPVTPDQALDIIRCTDKFLGDIDQIYWREDFVGGELFPGYLFTRRHTPNGFSWVHTDGTVGLNYYIPLAFVNMKNILQEWSYIAKAFPYLDLVIAITGWDQFPYKFELKEEDDDEQDDFYDEYTIEEEQYDQFFYRDVRVGLHIHDGEIELLDAEAAVSKYKEYTEFYQVEPREKYQANYYQDLGKRQDSWELLLQLIRAYGLDPEKVTSYGRPLISDRG